MRFPRASGLLLHPTALPGRFGIGDLGEEANRFIDFLARSGQSLWQVLPLGPTGFGDSPYQCLSAFAGNPLLVDPSGLLADGLLSQVEVADAERPRADRVDFPDVIATRATLLSRAAERLVGERPALRDEFDDCARRHAAWLDDHALFVALKEAHGGAPWHAWPEDLRRREPDALARARRDLAGGIAGERFRQVAFLRQWEALHAHARAAGVSIVGDVPIFVALDSSDVWANPHLFLLDTDGRPTVVAGVPPDYFSETGQLWGNPLYRWSTMARDGYAWWIARVRAALELVDALRIDHFIGFTRSWQVAADAVTAIEGSWEPGPGAELLLALEGSLGRDLPIIAEDLGSCTPEVEALRDGFGLTGMKVLQFAFSGDPANLFLPHHHAPNFAVYTGTHDNDTTRGWFDSLANGERSFVQRYLGCSGDDIAWDLIRASFASVADLAIVPVQDVLALGSSARMNLPGRADGNWSWRLRPGELHDGHAERLAGLAALYSRTPRKPSAPKAGEGPAR